MTLTERRENLELFVLQQKTLLAGHSFKVVYVQQRDGFDIVFEKIAHSTLNTFRNILLVRELIHVEVKAIALDDDFTPHLLMKPALTAKQRRRKRRKNRENGGISRENTRN